MVSENIIGIVLIVAAIALGYMGYKKWDESTKSIEVGKLELSAGKQSGKNTAYFFFGGAVVALIAGVVVIRKT